jgi:ClpX C4-type zinc finger
VPGGRFGGRSGGFELDNGEVSRDSRHMGLDMDLVRDAEAARQRLIQSQHAAEQAKADYHHAIRRLHAAGGSLREIAEVLRLSHQRVHQIIDEAAEPEPRRWWRRRRGQPWPWQLQGQAGPCSFCGRPREACAKLIAGPGIFICDGCVARASRLAVGAAAEGEVGGSAPLLVEPSGSEAKCSFCGKQAQHVQRLVAGGVASTPGGKSGQVGQVGQVGKGPRIFICDECLALCEEILAETATS